MKEETHRHHLSAISPLSFSMDIQTKVLQHRDQITVVAAVSVVISLFVYAAPRFLSILAFFWPLFVSTAVLLVAMIAFGGSFPVGIEVHGVRAGEGILDYVAGRPEYPENQYRYQ